MEAEAIRQTLTDYFSHQADIDTVLLFGSFAKGRENRLSDIDIAVHQYENIDCSIIFAIITSHLGDFKDFAGFIEKLL